MKENDSLREQLEKTTQGEYDDIFVDDVFKRLYVEDDSRGSSKTRAHSLLMHANIKTIGDGRGKTACDLLNICYSGIDTCAIIIVVFEHYGVNIEIPNFGGHKLVLRQNLHLITEAVAEYRNKIIYKD